MAGAVNRRQDKNKPLEASWTLLTAAESPCIYCLLPRKNIDLLCFAVYLILRFIQSRETNTVNVAGRNTAFYSDDGVVSWLAYVALLRAESGAFIAAVLAHQAPGVNALLRLHLRCSI